VSERASERASQPASHRASDLEIDLSFVCWPAAAMAIGGFVDAPAAAAGADYGGRVTSFVVLSCIVAGSGGILFGYDLGISGCVALRCYYRNYLATSSPLLYISHHILLLPLLLLLDLLYYIVMSQFASSRL